MDCFSVESEFIESLDFLSPPVKRIYNSRDTFGSVFQHEPSNVHLLRGLRNKFVKRVPSSTRQTRTVKTNAESSTSLVLKKTSERQILEHYSIVSYTSLQQEDDTLSLRKSDKYLNPTSEKPLIKVTVIPKSDQVQTAKILRKRRYIPKRVQSTSSNHENSVQTKNVYLIVAGRRREKIYEIKTTGSAQFSTDHDSQLKDDDIPIKELSHFKHLIQSLNMDRRKKKVKPPPVVKSDMPQQTSVIWKPDYQECDDCVCDENIKDSDPKIPEESRVRIFGQFGISEDDQYVLRYGATINDKEVLSDVAQLTRDFSPVLVPPYGLTCEEDLDQPTNSCFKINNEFNPMTLPDQIPSKESQGTQVNFRLQVANPSTLNDKISKYSDKKIQCTCCTTENRLDNKGLKECQSPLVIISVYPKQSPEDVTDPNLLGPTQSPPTNQVYSSNQMLRTHKGIKRSNTETRKSSKRNHRSRSPSLSKHSSSTKDDEGAQMIESRINKSRMTEKRSPDRQKPLRTVKDKIKEKEKIKHDIGTTRSSKYITSNATQVSKNLQNVTVSNATQVSNKYRQNFVSSNGTQVSSRNRKNYYTVPVATQYSIHLQKNLKSNATQSVKSREHITTPLKHPIKVIIPIKQSNNSCESNATQAPKMSVHYVANNGTQVSRNEPPKASNATQVTKNEHHFIAAKMSKNQETYTAPITTKFKKHEKSPKKIARSREKGTNTDHARAKKALVDTYTKKLTEQMSQRSYPYNCTNSKVTINIDGDGEYYDVLFNQDKITTDLTIRKKLKDMGSQKYENEEVTTIENLLLSPDNTDAKESISPDNKSPTKSLSMAVYTNLSEDDSPITKHVSRVTIRDSLEISHRREDKGNSHTMKNTQTCFTAQIPNRDNAEFAPIKHFTGDDCSICDPVERDKQIRQLLGVDKLINSKTLQAHKSEKDGRIPYHSIYREECENNQVTEINFEFQKLFPYLKTPSPRIRSNVSVQCQQCQYIPCRTSYNRQGFIYGDENEGYDYEEKCCVNPSMIEKCCVNPSIIEKCCVNPPIIEKCCVNASISEKCCTSPPPEKCCVYDSCDDICDDPCYEPCYEECYEYEDPCNQTDLNEDNVKDKCSGSPAIYQQLILNRNIQVFLQVEQFTKQKPIILTRKQYNKVKRTIQKTICKKKSSHDKRKKYVCNKCERSEVSVGAVRKKRGKDTRGIRDIEAQTITSIKDSLRKREKKLSSKCLARKARSRQTSVHQLSSNQSIEGHRNKRNWECSKSRNRKSSADRFYRNRKSSLDRLSHSQRLSELDLLVRRRLCSLDRLKRNENLIDQNIEVYTLPSSTNASRYSEHNKKKYEELVVQIGEQIGDRENDDRNKGRIIKSKTERELDRLGEKKRERISERYSEQKRERSPEHHYEQKEETGLGRYTEVKRQRSPERCFEHIGEPSPEQDSEQKRQRNPDINSEHKGQQLLERYNEQKGQRIIEKHNEQKGQQIPERHNEQKGQRSPGRYSEHKKQPLAARCSEQKGLPSLRRYNEQNSQQNPKRYSEQKGQPSPKRYNDQKGQQVPVIQSEQKGQRLPELHSEHKGQRVQERYSKQKRQRIAERHSEQKREQGGERNTSNKEESNPKPDSDQNVERHLVQYVDENTSDRLIEKKETEVKTLVLFNAEDTKGTSKNGKETDSPTRRTMSSVEIRYASVAYMKQMSYSSTDVGALSDSSLVHVNSFQTIFRGHRKSPTPNLGTSAYSLYSEDVLNNSATNDKSAKFIMEPRDSKPKKPFLRRLMSCLVMRSTRESELKLPIGRAPDLPSVNSSIDSYHISTSLGAVEVSSSIYDTSASFYSNHTILPVNSKIKRGFFSSVRGFLTNRKS